MGCTTSKCSDVLNSTLSTGPESEGPLLSNTSTDLPQAVYVEVVEENEPKPVLRDAIMAQPLPYYYDNNPQQYNAASYGTWPIDDRTMTLREQEECRELAIIFFIFLFFLVCFVLFFVPWEYYDDDYNRRS